MSAKQIDEEDQDDLFLDQKLQKMLEKKKLCKFIKDLDNISATKDFHDSSYTVRFNMNDSCRLQEETNDDTLRVSTNYAYDLEESLMLIEKIRNLSKSKKSYRKGNKRLTIEKKATYQPFDGQGITKLTNGDVVFVKWQNGTVEGKAKVLYNSGNTYVGGIKDYRRCGSGIYISKRNSYRYQGEFANDLFEGKGVLTDDQGSIIQKGIWRKGSLIQPLN